MDQPNGATGVSNGLLHEVHLGADFLSFQFLNLLFPEVLMLWMTETCPQQQKGWDEQVAVQPGLPPKLKHRWEKPAILVPDPGPCQTAAWPPPTATPAPEGSPTPMLQCSPSLGLCPGLCLDTTATLQLRTEWNKVRNHTQVRIASRQQPPVHGILLRHPN